jgi:hypothetical protein
MSGTGTFTANPQIERDLERGLFPLVATKNNHAYPIGTAACISKIGIVATAMHNLQEALSYHDIGDRLRIADAIPDDLDLKGLGLSVVWRETRAAAGRVSIWPIEHATGGPPSDVLFAYPMFQTSFSFQAFRLSFDMPRIGSVARCVGYADMRPTAGIDLAALKSGTLNWAETYSHQFHYLERQVKAVFIRQFARKYIEGPCAIIECDVPHGMSGGPVFNQDGNVWGTISAGGSQFFGHPATIVSLLYPLLLTPIRVSGQFGPIKVSAEHPLLEYVGTEVIRTDGSEVGVNIQDVDGGYAVGPRVHRDDASHVFADFQAFQDKRPSPPYVGEAFLVKRRAANS